MKLLLDEHKINISYGLDEKDETYDECCTGSAPGKVWVLLEFLIVDLRVFCED
jgi:hypothetical protein